MKIIIRFNIVPILQKHTTEFGDTAEADGLYEPVGGEGSNVTPHHHPRADLHNTDDHYEPLGDSAKGKAKDGPYSDIHLYNN